MNADPKSAQQLVYTCHNRKTAFSRKGVFMCALLALFRPLPFCGNPPGGTIYRNCLSRFMLEKVFYYKRNMKVKPIVLAHQEYFPFNGTVQRHLRLPVFSSFEPITKVTSDQRVKYFQVWLS